ncbi:unnamed protein product [Rhodiola kirilowii]
MEASLPSSLPLMNATTAERRIELVKKMREHEVAVVELSSLSTSRAVYQKQGNIYFLTTAQKAKASEQKLLDVMQNLNSP